MEELKALIGLVAGLPNAALWVIAALFAYKVVVVGSIYGVIRFSVERLYLWAITPREKIHTVNILGKINDMCITLDGSHDRLLEQLYRLRGKGTTGKTPYIHGCSVDWLTAAISEKEARDAEKAGGK